jgi:hypothetical protein
MYIRVILSLSAAIVFEVRYPEMHLFGGSAEI